MNLIRLLLYLPILFFGCKDSDEPEIVELTARVTKVTRYVEDMEEPILTSSFEYDEQGQVVRIINVFENGTDADVLQTAELEYAGDKVVKSTTTLVGSNNSGRITTCMHFYENDFLILKNCERITSNSDSTTEQNLMENFKWSEGGSKLENDQGGIYTVDIDKNPLSYSQAFRSSAYGIDNTIIYSYDDSKKVLRYTRTSFMNQFATRQPSKVSSMETTFFGDTLIVYDEIEVTYSFNRNDKGQLIDISSIRDSKRTENGVTVSEVTGQNDGFWTFEYE